MWPLLILGGAYALLARRPRRNPDWYTDAEGRHHPIRQGDGRAGDKTPYSRDLGKDSATPRASRTVKVEPPEVVSEPLRKLEMDFPAVGQVSAAVRQRMTKVEPPKVVASTELSSFDIEQRRDKLKEAYKRLYARYSTLQQIFINQGQPNTLEQAEYLKRETEPLQRIVDSATVLYEGVTDAQARKLLPLDLFTSKVRDLELWAKQARNSAIEAPTVLTTAEVGLRKQKEQTEDLRRKQVEDQKETARELARKAHYGEWQKNGSASKLEYFTQLKSESDRMWSENRKIFDAYKDSDRPSWIGDSEKEILPLKAEVDSKYFSANKDETNRVEVVAQAKRAQEIAEDARHAERDWKARGFSSKLDYLDKLKTRGSQLWRDNRKIFSQYDVYNPPPSWISVKQPDISPLLREVEDAYLAEVRRLQDDDVAKMRQSREDSLAKQGMAPPSVDLNKLYESLKDELVEIALGYGSARSPDKPYANPTAAARKSAAYKVMRGKGIRDSKTLDDFWYEAKKDAARRAVEASRFDAQQYAREQARLKDSVAARAR